MEVLIKNAIIIHQESEFHLKCMDIHVANGIIQDIGKNLTVQTTNIIQGNMLHCCIGLCDIGTQSGEPGYEHRETMNTLTKSALAGGFTTLAVFPNTKPIVQSKGNVRFLAEHPDRNGVEIIPIGGLSKDLAGIDITEYMDLASEGVKAISDGMTSIHDTGLLGRALQYAKNLHIPIIHHPIDTYLSQSGEMHEGKMSTSLGMKGVPDIAELNVVQRDILLNDYNQSILIEHAISSEVSVKAISTAKSGGNQIYTTVSYLNLLHTDEDLHDFDSNLKVEPVLRSEKDRKALIEGLKSGTIDAIISNHTPWDEEAKKLEFPYAKPGAAGLETCLAACLTGLKNELDISTIVHKLTVSPRNLLNLAIPEFKKGAKANICVFDTETKWEVKADEMKSKSINNPYTGKLLNAKVIATLI